MRKILITGATGKIGSELISLLSTSKEDWQIVVDTRNPNSQRVSFLRKLSRHPIIALTLNDKLFNQKALDDLTDVFVIAQVSEHMAEWHKNLMDLIRNHASSPNIIKVSVTGAKNPTENPETGMVPGQHWKGEQIIRDTGWTNVSIRPNIFMQHFMMNTGLHSKGAKEIFLPFSETSISWLDCNDIALCAFHLFTKKHKMESYNSKAFELTGQNAISPEEMSETLSFFLNEKVKHHSSIESFENRCLELGISDWAKHFYKEASEGWFSAVSTDDFLSITGRLPRNFSQFVLSNQGWFS